MKKPLFLIGFAFALLSFAPATQAVGEVCGDGTNNCCTAPAIVEEGGGCGPTRAWIGAEATGSCQEPPASNYPCGTSFRCSTNSCTSAGGGPACPGNTVNLGGGVCAPKLTVFQDTVTTTLAKLWNGDIIGRMVYVADADCSDGEVPTWDNTAKEWVCGAGGGGGAFQINGSDAYYDSGNVAIGTNTATVDLTIRDDTGNSAGIDLVGGNQSPDTEAFFYAVSSTGGTRVGRIGTASDHDFEIWTDGNSASGPRMVIGDNGDVGIGTDSPSFPLHVFHNDTEVARFEGNDHAVVSINGTVSSEKSINFNEDTVMRWKIGMDNDNDSTPTDAFVIKHTNNSYPQFMIHSNGNLGITGASSLTMGAWNSGTPDQTPDAQLVLDGSHNSGINNNTKLLIRGMDNESNVKAISVVDENSNELFALNSTPLNYGQAVFKGEVRGGYNTNTTSYFGRAAVGYNPAYSDYAAFGHLDSNAAGGYAVLQHPNGTTYINAATGRTLYFREDNDTKMSLASGDFEMHGGDIKMWSDTRIGRDIGGGGEYAYIPRRTDLNVATYMSTPDDNGMSLETDSIISIVETDNDRLAGWFNPNTTDPEKVEFVWGGRIEVGDYYDSIDYSWHSGYEGPEHPLSRPNPPSVESGRARITFHNDDNTGIINPHNNYIGLMTAGYMWTGLNDDGRLKHWGDLHVGDLDPSQDTNFYTHQGSRHDYGAYIDGLLYVDDGEKPGGGSWDNSSDKRVKRDVEPFTDGLNKLIQIDPVSYTYNGLGGTPDGMEGVGVIAQDVEDLLPYSVRTVSRKLNPEDEQESDLLLFNPSALDFVLINAVKEQQAMIEELRLQNDELMERLETLQN